MSNKFTKAKSRNLANKNMKKKITDVMLEIFQFAVFKEQHPLKISLYLPVIFVFRRHQSCQIDYNRGSWSKTSLFRSLEFTRMNIVLGNCRVRRDKKRLKITLRYTLPKRV